MAPGASASSSARSLSEPRQQSESLIHPRSVHFAQGPAVKGRALLCSAANDQALACCRAACSMRCQPLRYERRLSWRRVTVTSPSALPRDSANGSAVACTRSSLVTRRIWLSSARGAPEIHAPACRRAGADTPVAIRPDLASRTAGVPGRPGRSPAQSLSGARALNETVAR